MQRQTENLALREQGEKYASEIVKWLKQFFPQNAITFAEPILQKTVQNGLRQMEERLKKTLTMLNLGSAELVQQVPAKLEHVLLYVENYVMQIFRDLLITEPPVISPSTLQCDDLIKVLPSKLEKTKGALLRDTLQMSHDDLLEYLDPQGTKLVDHLVSTSVLTESDEESLASSSTRRDKTRKLLSIVSSSTADKIESGFLPALDATHPQQAQSFRKKMKEVKNRPPTPTCISCRIRNEVDLCRIASFMYKKKNINKAVYEDLCNTSVPHQKKWDMVLESEKRQEAVIEALSTKYKDFYEQCQILEVRDLQCQCPVLNITMNRTSNTVMPGDDSNTIDLSHHTLIPEKTPIHKCSSISSIPSECSFDQSSVKSYYDTWAAEDFLACSTKRRTNRHVGKKVTSEKISRYLGLTKTMNSLDDDSITGSSSVNSSRRRSFLQRCSSNSSVANLSDFSSHMSVQEYWTKEFTPMTGECWSLSSTENFDIRKVPTKPAKGNKVSGSKTRVKERITQKASDVVWV